MAKQCQIVLDRYDQREFNVDEFAGRHGRLDGIEKADELAVAVTMRAAAKDGAV